MKRLIKKQASACFSKSELRWVKDLITLLNNKCNKLAGMAERSSNFDEPFDLIYNQIIPQLVQALRIETEDNAEGNN